MNTLPCTAKSADVVVYDPLHHGQRSPRKFIILSKFRWPSRSVQIEYGFAVRSDDVDMRWAMIRRIDHNPQPPISEHRQHALILA